MRQHPIRLGPTGSDLDAALATVRAELELPEGFSDEVLAETRDAIDRFAPPSADATDLPLVTIDPPGSTDLDQALAIERDGAGFVVHYAIADLPPLVVPGGAIDRAARERGQTLYAADGRVPLHPPEIGDRAASLLPDLDRGAYLWRFELGGDGSVRSTALTRARVRSRRQWSYAEAQDAVDDEPMFGLLREVGEARLALEAERGGASLSTPEILVERDDGGYRLVQRVLRPIDAWNAQLSLLTGMEAARMMLDARVGILRTMPPADAESVERFRRQTRALGTPWPEGVHYGDYLRGLAGDDPRHLAIRHAAGALFRGAAYAAFDGELPEETVQAAIGAPYTHATAPIRRLVDRFALAVCLAIADGTRPPAWALDALPELPAIMARSSNLAGRLDRLTLDTVEAAVLAPHVGELFDAVALDDDTVQLPEPPVEAPCDGGLEPGTDVRVRLAEASLADRTVRFEVS